MSFIPDFELDNLISNGVTHLGRLDDGVRIYCFTSPCQQVGYWDTVRSCFVAHETTWLPDDYRGLWTKLLKTK